MKKVMLIIAVIAMFSGGAKAQDAFNKETHLLKANLGFNKNGKPLVLAYEMGIVDNLFGVEKLNLGVGPYIGYYGYSQTVVQFGGSSKSSFKVVAIGISGYFHYQFIDKLDTYIGLSIGGSAQYTRTEAANMEAKTAFGGDVAWGTVGGARYEITPQWGAFIEGGHSTGNFTLGVAFKF
jgi:hypothetical protein